MTTKVRRQCVKRHEGVDGGMNKLKSWGVTGARWLITAVESH